MKFPEHFVYDRVYVIGFDGGGNFFRQAATPNIDRIFAYGAVHHFAQATIPTISGQCWGSIFHGVSPVLHRLSNDLCGSEHLPADYPYPSFFKVVREQYPDAVLASFNNWSAINYGIIENDLGVIMGKGNDDDITDMICECIEKEDPKLLFVHFDSPDEVGHHGFGSKYQLDVISHCDELFGRIYDSAEKKGVTENLLVIVTADHGGTPDGNHGDSSDGEKYVSYFVRGKSVIPGTPGEIESRDTASIVAFALGCDQPDIWSSRIPDHLFRDAPSFPHRTEVTATSPTRFAGRENLPTPGGEGKDISYFADTEGILCYLPFEHSVEDKTGRTRTEVNGKIYYTDGYFGKGAVLDDCTITIDGVDFGCGNFTIFAWIKNIVVNSSVRKTLFELKSDNGADFGVYIEGDEIIIDITCAGETNLYRSRMPANSDSAFIPFITSYDRVCNELCTYYDFYLDLDWYCKQKLPDGVAFKGDKVIVGKAASLEVDDLIIFNHKLSDSEIDRLMDYYIQ